jgi:hypothetical protein
MESWICSFFIWFFEDSLLAQGERPYWSMCLQVGQAFFAFSRHAFAAKLKVAEPLSGAGVGCATYQKLQTTLATVR